MQKKTTLCNMAPEVAGKLMGGMEYAALKRLVMALSNKLASDGLDTKKQGHVTLSNALREASISAYNAGRKIEGLEKLQVSSSAQQKEVANS